MFIISVIIKVLALFCVLGTLILLVKRNPKAIIPAVIALLVFGGLICTFFVLKESNNERISIPPSRETTMGTILTEPIPVTEEAT